MACLIPDKGMLLGPSSNQHPFIHRQKEKRTVHFSAQCLLKELPQKHHLANLHKENSLLLSSFQTQPAQSGTIPRVPFFSGLHEANTSNNREVPSFSPQDPADRGVSAIFVHWPWNTRPCRQRGHPHIGRGKSIYCLALPL